MKEYKDLTEAEKELRSLIFAIESNDGDEMGGAYLLMKLNNAKEVAKKLGIPLVKVK